MKFVAIDVETANPRMSSICQIGIVNYDECKETSADVRLVDPQHHFDPYSVAIHGITEERVRGSAAFPEVFGWLCDRISDQIVVSHSHFDRVSIMQTCERYGLKPPACGWIDTAQVARRAWPQFSRSGYGLANLAENFGVSFIHHDALQDARVCGLLFVKAIQETGYEPTEWLLRSKRPITSAGKQDIRREGDGDGPLLGECVVFTGALRMPRRTAADLAHTAGAAVEPSVTKSTTLLVVGDQDIERLGGYSKSAKHRKAEKLIEGGQEIRIIGEADFIQTCQLE